VLLSLIISLVAIMPVKPLVLNPFEAYVAQYLSHYLYLPVAPFHRQWCDALYNSDDQFLAIEGGRGTAKTTFGSIGFSLFNICESDFDEFQVVSRSGGVTGTARKIMRRVKRELETNELLIADYGIERGEHWGDEYIQVKRADGHIIDFYSMGKRSSIRGARGIVIIDDPQDKADCRSEAILERDEEWLRTDVIPVIIDDQRLIFIGTPISPLSLLSTVKQMPDFRTLSFPIEDPPYSGKSAWPARYSDTELDRRRRLLGEELYAGEYLCDPKVPGNPVFKRPWFREYDRGSEAFERIKRAGLFKVVGGDPADSKSQKANYTAFVTLGATLDRVCDVYVLDVRYDHWSLAERAQQPLRIFELWQQNQTVVESRVKEGSGDANIERIEEEERIQGKYVNLSWVKQVSDKVSRANEVQHLVQEGRVYLDLGDEKQRHLLKALTMFTGGQNYEDDTVDAFVIALKRIKEWSEQRLAGTEEPQQVLPDGYERAGYRVWRRG
jgi:predicted phage terminase large subunit-like protein